MASHLEDALASLSALADATRRTLYLHVRSQEDPVTREQVAGAVGISTKLATFHLEKLVKSGLLQGFFDGAANGRNGRVGRKPKLYRLSEEPIEVSLPARRYDLLARALSRAISQRFPGESVEGATRRLAREWGADLARQADHRAPQNDHLSGTVDILERSGFEPQRTENGIELRNCPFAAAAGDAPEVVCAMTRAFIEGLIGDGNDLRAEALSTPAGCCVRVRIVS